MIVRFCSCCEQQHSHSLLQPHPLQVDFSLLIGVHRIRPSEFEDIKLRRTLSLEMELLNAVAGGEDDHGLLRYRFGFVDITRTMTPMVTLLPSCAPLCRNLRLSAESHFWNHWPLDGWQNCAATELLRSKLIRNCRSGYRIAAITSWCCLNCTPAKLKRRLSS